MQASGLPFASKLAEYVFVPLFEIFQARNALPDRALEPALQCMQSLLHTGWRDRLEGDLAFQLMILFSYLAGDDRPRQSDNAEPPSEELQLAAFNALVSLLQAWLRSPDALPTLTLPAHVPFLARTVLVSAEAARNSKNIDIQNAALMSLDYLCRCIDHRQVLANFLPGIMSPLTYLLTPGSRQIGHYTGLVQALGILKTLLHRVLADEDTFPLPDDGQDDSPGDLGEAWLKATAAQIRLGLANIFKLHEHPRREVRSHLIELCFMLLESCQRSLRDSMSPTMEVLLTLANSDEGSSILERLRGILASSGDLAELVRSSVYHWLENLPVNMLSKDETKRLSRLARFSAGVQLLSGSHVDLRILSDRLQPTVREILETLFQGEAGFQVMRPAPAILAAGHVSSPDLSETHHLDFPPLLSSQHSLTILTSLARALDLFATSLQSSDTAAACLDDARLSTGFGQVSAFWIALDLLKRRTNHDADEFNQFIDLDLVENSNTDFDDLYSFALTVLHRPEDADTNPWQSQALAVEALTVQSRRLGRQFRPELVDALYPVVHLLGSPNSALRSYAMTALTMFAKDTQYDTARDLIVSNSDYLVNALSAKLNAYDLEPQVPTVLRMLTKLCGPLIVPYLDDLVDGLFDILDKFHGYPSLVEHVFMALGAAVEESTKADPFTEPYILAPSHQKRQINPANVDVTAIWLRERRNKRQRASVAPDGVSILPEQTPHEPWSNVSSTKAKPEATPPAPQKEKEAPLSATYKATLNIARHTIPHLASPSAATRGSLLKLLQLAVPLLAKHEDSFLPFVNDVWPSLLKRLYDEENYVVCASLDAITEMAKGSGDFLAGRIQSAWPELVKLWKRATDAERLETQMQRGLTRFGSVTSKDLAGILAQPLATGTPSKSSRTKDQSELVVASASRREENRTPSAYTATTMLRLKSALAMLFTALLSHVRLSDAVSNDIEAFLSPLALIEAKGLNPQAIPARSWQLTGHSQSLAERDTAAKAGDALRVSNADAIWYSWEKELWSKSLERREMWRERLTRLMRDVDCEGNGREWAPVAFA